MLKKIRRRLCRHEWEEISRHRDGTLRFSFNCARPGLVIVSECRKCGAVQEDDGWMCGEVIEWSPDVAARVLDDDFRRHGRQGQ